MTQLSHLSPKKAQQQLSDNPDILLLDIRSYAENKFVGRPLNAVLLPWIDEPDWQPNPNFDQLLLNILKDKTTPLNTEIILICRSGYRSKDAGRFLIKKGFTHISHVRTGFEGDLDENHQRGYLNGWRHDGLSWEQC